MVRNNRRVERRISRVADDGVVGGGAVKTQDGHDDVARAGRQLRERLRGAHGKPAVVVADRLGDQYISARDELPEPAHVGGSELVNRRNALGFEHTGRGQQFAQ